MLEENKMRKVFCVLVGLQVLVSGCSGHISSHCEAASDEIAKPPDTRVTTPY
jgi:hypothetical protein